MQGDKFIDNINDKSNENEEHNEKDNYIDETERLLSFLEEENLIKKKEIERDNEYVKKSLEIDLKYDEKNEEIEKINIPGLLKGEVSFEGIKKDENIVLETNEDRFKIFDQKKDDDKLLLDDFANMFKSDKDKISDNDNEEKVEEIAYTPIIEKEQLNEASDFSKKDTIIQESKEVITHKEEKIVFDDTKKSEKDQEINIITEEDFIEEKDKGQVIEIQIEKSSEELNNLKYNKRRFIKIFPKSIFTKSKFSYNKKMLGIDIGSFSIKIAEIIHTKKGPRISAYGIEEIPEIMDADINSRKESLKNIIAKLLDDMKCDAKDVVFSIYGPATAIRRIEEVGGGSQEEELDYKEAVGWELSKNLPFPIEKSYFDYTKLYLTGGKIAAAIKTEVYSFYKDLADNLGLNLFGLIPAPFALWQFMEHYFFDEISGDEIYCTLDIGAKFTHISFYQKGELFFSRELNIAVNNITEALIQIFTNTNSEQDSFLKAEEFKKNLPEEISDDKYYFGISGKQIKILLTPVIDRWINTVYRTIEYTQASLKKNAPSKILILGGGAQTKGLVSLIQKRTGISTAILDIDSLVNSEIKDKYLFIESATSIGLVLKIKPKINTIPDETKKELIEYKTFNLLFRVLPLTIIFLALTIVAFNNYLSIIKSQKEKYEKEILNFDENKAKYDKLLAESNELELIKSTQSTPMIKNIPWYEIFKEIAYYSPKELVINYLSYNYFEKDSLNINNKDLTVNNQNNLKISMGGSIFTNIKNKDGNLILSEFMLNLEKSLFFKDITLIKTETLITNDLKILVFELKFNFR